MRVALTVKDDRIAPLFETARKVLLIDLDGGSEEILPLLGPTGLDRVSELVATKAEVLVCGGVEAPIRRLLESRGIRVLACVTGDARETARTLGRRNEGPLVIAIPAEGPKPDDAVDSRFSRARYVLLHDPAAGTWEPLEIERKEGSGGGGERAARRVVEAGATVLVAGTCGPNARGTLEAASVAVVTGAKGTALSAVAAFLGGQLTASASDTEAVHAGCAPEQGQGGPDH